jgi:UDP-glucose 4-epimerase
MVKSALVTGAAGFIASHLVDHLLSRDYEVTGIDNLRSGRMHNLKDAMESPSFEFLEFDICSRDLCKTVDREFDIIYHLAAISSVLFSIKSPQMVNSVNVGGTLNILEFARMNDVRRVVLSSSAAVYGNPETLPVTENTPLDPLSPYAASKVGAEMYSRAYEAAYGIESVIFRYFNVYGPRQAFSEYSGVVSIFANQARKGEPIYIDGDGRQTRSFIHVEDVVRGTELGGRIEAAAGETINLSATDSVSILELASLIIASTKGAKSEIVFREPREGDVRESIGCMDKAEEILSFTPEVPLRTGIEETVAWYIDHA